MTRKLDLNDLPSLSEVVDRATTNQLQPTIVVPKPVAIDAPSLGDALLKALPDNMVGQAIVLSPQDYSCVLAAVQRNAAEYGGQLQWLTPQTFAWRGAVVLKGE